MIDWVHPEIYLLLIYNVISAWQWKSDLRESSKDPHIPELVRSQLPIVLAFHSTYLHGVPQKPSQTLSEHQPCSCQQPHVLVTRFSALALLHARQVQPFPVRRDACHAGQGLLLYGQAARRALVSAIKKTSRRLMNSSLYVPGFRGAHQGAHSSSGTGTERIKRALENRPEVALENRLLEA